MVEGVSDTRWLDSGGGEANDQDKAVFYGLKLTVSNDDRSWSNSSQRTL